MESVKTSLDLEALCSNGLSTLIAAISKSKQNGHTPMVLAISRRMPHILSWFKNTLASDQQKSILNDTEIITEIALPFIDFKKRPEIEIFLVDDVVSSGRTIDYVINLTEVIAKKRITKITVLFCDAYSPFLLDVIHEDIEIAKRYTNAEEKKQIVDFIATIIAVTLPIDVTYPILYFNSLQEGVELNDIHKGLFCDSVSEDNQNYTIEIKYKRDLKVASNEVKEGASNVSYTSILPSEISNSLNNDFAKIRSYNRFGEFIVVPYAPNILTDSNLKDKNLFKAAEYKKIWKEVIGSIDKTYLRSYSKFDSNTYVNELIMNRSYRSLVSVANYLYSISSFNRITKQRSELLASSEDSNSDSQSTPEGQHTSSSVRISDFVVKEEDLNLIIGRNLSLVILPQIKYILEKKIVSPRTHEKFNVPSTFIPKIYEQDYTISKYTSVPLGEASLQMKLNAIFKNAFDKRLEYPAFLVEDIEYDVEGVMESFESLESALHIKVNEKKEEINKWVDQKIDSAEIVSRYASVEDDNGLRHWRRFFRLSSSVAD